MKFCMVTTFYPPFNFGGDGIFVYRLANELARRGHRVDVIHCEDSYRLFQSSPGPEVFANHADVRVHRLKSRARWLSPLLTQQTGSPALKNKKLRALLETSGYDVIHYHNMSLMGITALAYGDAIKLYTLHEHWLVCPMHVLWRFDREVCTRRTCFRCTLAGRRPPQLWRYTGLLERTLGHVDSFIAPSRFTRQKHLELGLDVPIAHIPHFLAAPAAPAAATAQSGRPYFLFVGRLEKIKGVQNIIPVFRTRGDYDLLLAGDGTYENVLRAQAGDLPNVKFLGRVSQEELPALYANAVAVIVPSICYEVFGIIVIEAFAMKTPVIVNNLGALPEAVEDSGGGFVYNNGDELARAMDVVANDAELQNELGNKGYQAYQKYWTEDRHIERYLGLIDDLKRARS
ncbi:MAG: glycosyltransferase family 4 protein [bacterium]|nr:glycosyltransferase family 4 protein [bacterium]